MGNHLTVAIQQDGRWYSPRATGIKFVDAAPGGCISAQFNITDDYSLALLDNLSPSSLVRISSKRSGKCVWSGEVDSPGVTMDPDGRKSLHPTCAGTGTMLDQVHARLPYIATSYDSWEADPVDISKPTAQIGTGACPWNPDLQVLLLRFPSGTLAPGDRARMRYTGFLDSPMTLGGMAYNYGSGALSYADNTPYFKQRIYVGRPAGGTKALDATPDGSPHFNWFVTDPGVAPAPMPAGKKDLSVEWRFDKPDEFATTADYWWAGFWNLYVYGQRVDRYGAAAPTVAKLGTPLAADQIIEDLIGRLLVGLVDTDPTRTVISATSTIAIDNLDYSTNAVSPADILADLMLMDPTFYWRADPHGATTGKFPLKWLPWGTAPRYSLPNRAVEWDQQGSGTDLCNKVTVTWLDPRGQRRQTTRTAPLGTYDALSNLEAQGRTREAPIIDLDKTVSSITQANTVLAAYLDQVVTLPRAGKATVTVPLVDATTGTQIPPEELQAGQIVHLPDTGENLRVTQVEYDDDAEAATLSIASPRKSATQIIADITARRRRRR